MVFSKCRNSVFCVFLLLCFLAGTICGVLCFRIFLSSDPAWLSGYITQVFRADLFGFLGFFFSRLRPFLVLSLLCTFPYRNKLILTSVFFRGCMGSYLFSALFCAGCPVIHHALSIFVALSGYLWLCGRLYILDDVPLAPCFVFSAGISTVSSLISYCSL